MRHHEWKITILNTVAKLIGWVGLVLLFLIAVAGAALLVPFGLIVIVCILILYFAATLRENAYDLSVSLRKAAKAAK
jgi:hypothetical protein